MSADELAADIDRRIRRNLGTFGVPIYNHTGDPHDKFGKYSAANRLTPSTRDGISYSQPAGLWKEVVFHERRAAAAATASAPAAVAAAAAAPAPAPAPAVLPPGWYYVPSVGAGGEAVPALAYVPYHFAAPPAMAS